MDELTEGRDMEEGEEKLARGKEGRGEGKGRDTGELKEGRGMKEGEEKLTRGKEGRGAGRR
jgi:hypothetical protein